MVLQDRYKIFYHVFRDISRIVHASTRLQEVLDLVVWKISDAFSAAGAILRLLNLETDELEISAACGFGENNLKKGAVSNNLMITELCRKNKINLIEDILGDSRVQYPREVWEEGIRFILDIPLFVGEHVVGIIRVYFNEKRTFREEELDFMVAVAQQCSCAIDKARLIENQESKYHRLALQTEKLSALGQMAAGIAHEINNPLAGILLYSSNLVKKAPPGSPFQEGLDVIIHETIRCRRIIQGLLEFSREREPRMALASVNEIIDKSLRILENEFRIQRIRLCRDLQPELPPTMLDGGQMEQVFVNLVINAVEAVDQDGEVTIRSRADTKRGCIVVEIQDNGPGMDAKTAGKIFEPFFSTKSKGTGLGLAVTYGILKKHDGNIRVESQPGHGTRFVLELPITRAEGVIASPEAGR